MILGGRWVQGFGMELWLLNIYYTVEQGEGPWDEGLQTETLSEISQESTETPNRSWEKCARAVFKIREDWFFSFLLTLKSCSRDLGRKKTTPKYFWAVLQSFGPCGSRAVFWGEGNSCPAWEENFVLLPIQTPGTAGCRIPAQSCALGCSWAEQLELSSTWTQLLSPGPVLLPLPAGFILE